MNGWESDFHTEISMDAPVILECYIKRAIKLSADFALPFYCVVLVHKKLYILNCIKIYLSRI